MRVSGVVILAVEPGNVVFDGDNFGYTITYTVRGGRMALTSEYAYHTANEAKAKMRETVYLERKRHLV